MALSPGDRLGPYDVIAAIGAGGMGEVYKARDTRLDRTVAVKVSNAEFSERFDREARAVAALNHPHICTLHDVGPNYLVMEYIEGEPVKGPLPLDQALQYAGQICDALIAAHKKGITHRDLKPANILVTKAGVKLLDFGLAKFTQAAPAPSDATLTMALTGKNEIVGTLYYMSPEQLEAQANGQEIDGRSDIFSFGVVLYEMLTGKRAFEGSSMASVIAAIMERPAPSIASVAPPALDSLLQTCLAKDPDERWQTARDLKRELLRVASFSSEPTAVAPITKPASWPWAVAGVTTLALLVAGAGWYRSATLPAPPRPMIRLNAEIAPGLSLPVAEDFGGRSLAISPDGARLAVVLRDSNGKTLLYTRLLHQSQVTPLAGTENASGPFFSPAGDWIGFIADRKLKKIPVEGGAAVTLCDVNMPFGASWGEDGNIIVASSWRSGLSRVPATGGTLVPVTKLNAGEATHRFPQVIPGTQAVLFTVHTNVGADYNEANIDVFSPQTGERKTLVREGFSGRYLADGSRGDGTGHLVFLRQTTLFAVPFDPVRLAVMGAPAPMVEDVSSRHGSGDFVFGRNGTFVHHSGRGYEEEWPISWVTRGSVSSEPTLRERPSEKTVQPAQALHAKGGVYYGPTFSPDGARLAFAAFKGKDSDIWVKDLARDTVTRLTSFQGWNLDPVWTPDGKYIVFRSINTAAPGLYGVRSDGSRAAERLTEEQPPLTPHSFSPDGKRLAVTNGYESDVFTLPVEPGAGPGGGLRLGKAEPFVSTQFRDFRPVFSPDGRWLAYSSNESGPNEVYVRPFPGPGGRWQISTGGGRQAKWTRDGRELLFVGPNGRVLAVSYTVKGESFLADKPRVWADIRLRSANASGDTWDISPDGKRLAAMLMDDGIEEKPATHLRFLLNFTDELRRKVGAEK